MFVAGPGTKARTAAAKTPVSVLCVPVLNKFIKKALVARLALLTSFENKTRAAALGITTPTTRLFATGTHGVKKLRRLGAILAVNK